MLTLLVALLAGCMTEERWLEEHADAICEHRSQCPSFEGDVDGVPCDEAYVESFRATVEECGIASDEADAVLAAAALLAATEECDQPAGHSEAWAAYVEACGL